ncbi:ribonuclease HII [Alteribacillus iranensis]|uniref:Ribonuclease HII n=1 Tax=Alteribacillus iranensis TaxID=930128 RepID=A0A1I2A8U9_9BACI|nr:ribonuclease HII [Alteribacillus iranensis]SFE39413.1 RNase HII [Alteribacillus iranensis]
MPQAKMTIAEIKHHLNNGTAQEDWIRNWRGDDRKGVRQLIEKYDRHMEQAVLLQKQYETLLSYEKEWRQKGYKYIAGVDEVGRGPLAGPVTACAAVLPENEMFPGLTDSKKLSRAKREYFGEVLKDKALSYHIVHVFAQTIDEVNIYQASKEAMMKSVNGLDIEVDALFIDAMTLPTAVKQLRLIQGDAKSASIAAASVLAKTARDQYMIELAEKYPEYGFEQHMGYGTKEHLEALRKYGPTPEHRCSFSPVQAVL